MPTLNQVRNKVDDWATTAWVDFILPRQQQYFEAHGHFWQGLMTHTYVPNADPLGYHPEIGDLLDSSPTDQASTWRQAFPEVDVPLDFALKSDVYEGPLGHGFWVTLYVAYQGVVYRRIKGYGPEDHDAGWAVLEEVSLP